MTDVSTAVNSIESTSTVLRCGLNTGSGKQNLKIGQTVTRLGHGQREVTVAIEDKHVAATTKHVDATAHRGGWRRVQFSSVTEFMFHAVLQ